MEYKKGDTVMIQDGKLQRSGVVVEDGIDSKNRVRVRPDRISMDMSISTTPNNTTYIIE